MSGPALRPAQPDDAAAAGAILSAFIDGNAWMPRLHSREGDTRFCARLIATCRVTVAECDGQVAGFLAREGSEVDALYVAPDCRGVGIGKALLDAAKAEAPRLALWTFQANVGAQRFYLREGFSEARRTDGSKNDEHLPDIRLVWERNAP